MWTLQLSWSAQWCRVRPQIESEPAALCIFTLLRRFVTLSWIITISFCGDKDTCNMEISFKKSHLSKQESLPSWHHQHHQSSCGLTRWLINWCHRFYTFPGCSEVTTAILTFNVVFVLQFGLPYFMLNFPRYCFFLQGDPWVESYFLMWPRVCYLGKWPHSKHAWREEILSSDQIFTVLSSYSRSLKDDWYTGMRYTLLW